MKKILFLSLALTLSVGLWAETRSVSYRYPVYKTDGVATSGIKEWKTGNVTATVVENATDQVTWGTKGGTTWYVVKGADITLSKGAVCKGDVRLILADGAKLTATGVITPYIASDGTPSIQVSGDDNSLTIYGESTHSGQLIAKGGDYSAGIGGKTDEAGSNITINGGIVTATAGDRSAGIGGGEHFSGSNITINGGIVVATGGLYAAGIGGGESGSGSDITINGGIVKATGGRFGAGIGGGENGKGSNITINGGIVTATGGEEHPGWGGPGDGIGNGDKGTGSNNIKVATDLLVKADNNNPPTTVIKNDGTDLASSLAGKRYAIVESSYKGELTKWCFVISKNNLTYNGEAQFATAKLIEGIEGAGDITVTYKQNNTVVTDPVNAGIYDIYVAVSEGSRYLAFAETKIGTLTINRANLTASNFTYTAPSNLIWDGNTKIATVTFKEGKLTGCGKITVKYNGNTEAPSVDDDYIVSIDVEEGENYNAATGLTDDAWKFTIRVSVLVSYINEKYEYKTVEAWEVRNADKQVTWIAGWYAVTGADVRLPKGAVCKGAVHLILADGAKLTATGETQLAGITVSGNENSLTIYGQIAQSGQLIANGGYQASGIGGGYWADGNNITINGGKVTATGGEEGAGIGGGWNRDGIYITINGGIVTATGGKYGAGIGGGEDGLGSNIIINGGTVTANGGEAGLSVPAGAGIGSGGDGALASNIIVNSQCSVKADGKNPPKTVIENKGGDLASSLAGKRYAIVESPAKSDLTTEDIVISSNSATYDGEAKTATVKVKEGITGAGQIVLTYKQGDEEVTPVNAGTYDIYVAVTEGANYKALLTTKLGTLTIAKADLTADNFTYTAPEDLDWDGNAKTAAVTFNSQDSKLSGCGEVTVKYKKGGVETSPVAGGDYTVSIDVAEGTNYNAAAALTKNNWKFTIIAPIQVSYIDENGEEKTVDAWEVTSADQQVTWNKSWYVVNGEDVQLSKGAVCNGDVHLILADGATLTVTGDTYQAGIGVSGEGNSLTIYGQVNQSGQLIANGGNSGAGIGGGNEADGSNITINGGVVIATGYTGAAGIGGGNRGNGTYITINSGTVEANGAQYQGAGIGGGFYGSCSYININGGTVKANGALFYGVGIGSGYLGGSASNIFVATTLAIKADGNITPTTPIENDGGDLASNLAGKHYVTIEPKGTLTADDFVVSDNIVTYDGEVKTATVAFKDDITGAGQITVTYKQNSEEVTPKNVGEYDIYVSVTESANYKAFESTNLGILTIAKADLTASDFTYLAPEDLIWDGNAKTATVTFKSQDKLTGCGEITVKYQKDAVETSPVDAGNYTVSIDVAEGDNYASATGLTDASWKFTIELPIGEWITLRTEVTANDWNTICMERTITDVDGATFWNVVSETEKEFILEQEFAPFAAGVGYIIRYTATELKVKYGDQEATEPVTATQDHPIQGRFAEITCDQDGQNELVNNYVVYGNQLRKVTGWVTMADHRAYVIPNIAPSKAPAPNGAPRMTMPKPNSTPTGNPSLHHSINSSFKVIEDGQLMIIRDNKMYNAQGVEIQ